ncbi:unnamed protein product [Closterium sp. Yama58-4]|nr:unnamed protein product [Closterium sp. Yama58-4]
MASSLSLTSDVVSKQLRVLDSSSSASSSNVLKSQFACSTRSAASACVCVRCSAADDGRSAATVVNGASHSSAIADLPSRYRSAMERSRAIAMHKADEAAAEASRDAAAAAAAPVVLERVRLVAGQEECGGCEAAGSVPCATCAASGLYVDPIMECQGIIVKVRCLGCGGSGTILCPKCGGRGHKSLHGLPGAFSPSVTVSQHQARSRSIRLRQAVTDRRRQCAVSMAAPPSRGLPADIILNGHHVQAWLRVPPAESAASPAAGAGAPASEESVITWTPKTAADVAGATVGSQLVAGSISLDSDLIGFSTTGASTITLRLFKLPTTDPTGTGVAALSLCTTTRAHSRRREREDVLVEFKNAEEHERWGEELQRWRRTNGRPSSLLVVLNPVGGKGMARDIYKRDVEPLLKAADVKYELIETQRYRHAVDIAKDMRVGEYDGVVCVGGDGIPAEVLNGLLARSDWKEAIRTPLGVIPAGSGNGMAKSLLHASGEECTPQNATRAVILGRSTAVDVGTVSQPHALFHFILNVNWAFVSDVDIESEVYRWMGGFRLTFYSIIRIMNLRRYHARLSYLPAAASTAPTAPGALQPEEREGGVYAGVPAAALGDPDAWVTVEGEFVLLWCQNTAWAAEAMHVTPQAELSDGCLDMIVVRECTSMQLLELMMQMEENNGKHIASPLLQYIKVRALKLEAGGRVRHEPGRGGIVAVDGEVVARGVGAFGFESGKDPMDYGGSARLGAFRGAMSFAAPWVSSSASTQVAFSREEEDEINRQRLNAELQRLQRLPPTSIYASHRIRVARRALELLSASSSQRSTDQERELEALFASLSL